MRLFRHLTQILLILAQLLLFTLPVLATEPKKGFDKAKAAEVMSAQAREAYEAGNHARAAELYLDAYRTDPVPGYLYSAARAEQVAGKTDLAVEHFKQFLALPSGNPAVPVEPERLARAQGLLAEIAKTRLDTRVAEGQTAVRAGDYLLAVQIWLAVYAEDPARVELLYRSAVANYQAGRDAEALKLFDRYVEKAPPDAVDRAQARVRRDALQEKLHPAPMQTVQPKAETKQAVKPAEIVVDQPRPEPVRWPGWLVTSAGLGLLGGGLGLYFSTQSDVDALHADMTPDADGQIRKISVETANSRYDSIHTRQVTAIALAGVGVAALGTGIWLLVRHPDEQAQALTVTPMGLAWQF